MQPDRKLALSGLPEGDLLSAALKAGILETHIDFLTGEKITWGSLTYHELDQLVSSFWQTYEETRILIIPGRALLFRYDIYPSQA